MSAGSSEGAAEVVMPPTKLRDLVGDDGPDPEVAIGRAEQATGDLRRSFADEVREDAKKLAALARALQADGEADAQAVRGVYRIAHNLRGTAGTFGYRLLSEVASSLCTYLDRHPCPRGDERTVVRLHLDALLRIVADDLQGDGGSVGRVLLADLGKLSTKSVQS